MFGSRFFFAAMFAAGCFAGAAEAGLVLGEPFSLTWNTISQPGGSDSVTISAYFDGVGNSSITSFGIGIQITGGTEGKLRLANASFPTDNSVFGGFATPSPVTSNVLEDVLSLNGENALFANASIPLSGKNLLTFNFSSDDAVISGTFSIWAVPEFTSYFTTTDFDGRAFENAASAPLLLGTVTVVPEAKGVWMAGGAGLFAVSMMVRRRRHRSGARVVEVTA